MNPSVQHQIQKLIYAKEILSLQLQQKKQALNKEYAQYIQELLSKKDKLCTELDKLFCQQTDNINNEIILLLTKHNTPSSSSSHNIHTASSSNSYLLSNPMIINKHQTHSQPQRQPQHTAYPQNTNNSVSLSSTIQSVPTEQTEVKQPRFYRRVNNNHNKRNFDETSSVSSDESVSSSDNDDHEQQQRSPLTSIGTRILNGVHNGNINRNRARANDMEIDQESSENVLPAINTHSVRRTEQQRREADIHRNHNSMNDANGANRDKVIDIGSNGWLYRYITDRENVGNDLELEINESHTITLNMSDLSDNDHDAICEILEKMKINRLFQQCYHIHIISPPPLICHELPRLIGQLPAIQTAKFDGLSFFSLIKVMNKLPHSNFDLLEMKNVEIIAPSYPEFEEDEEYINEKEIDGAVFRILSCKQLSIQTWRCSHQFWNHYLSKFQRKFKNFKSEMVGVLETKMKQCCLRSLEFIGGDPDEDDIPHFMIQFIMKHYAEQLEVMKVDFVDKDLYKGCMPWMYQKTVNKNLSFDRLKEIWFKWTDDQSTLLLKIIMRTSPHIEKIKLILPNKRLSQTEMKLIKKLEAKTVVEKCVAMQ